MPAVWLRAKDNLGTVAIFPQGKWDGPPPEPDRRLARYAPARRRRKTRDMKRRLLTLTALILLLGVGLLGAALLGTLYLLGDRGRKGPGYTSQPKDDGPAYGLPLEITIDDIPEIPEEIHADVFRQTIEVSHVLQKESSRLFERDFVGAPRTLEPTQLVLNSQAILTVHALESRRAPPGKVVLDKHDANARRRVECRVPSNLFHA